jgi:prolipoprotein diacylglyceryltransferase
VGVGPTIACLLCCFADETDALRDCGHRGAELRLSKALAALVAGWLLQRELARRGRAPELAFPVTVAAVVGGFVGGKLYFLLEQGGSVTMHDLGGSGFTWYGGVIGGAAAVWWVARRRGMPIGELAGAHRLVAVAADGPRRF